MALDDRSIIRRRNNTAPDRTHFISSLLGSSPLMKGIYYPWNCVYGQEGRFAWCNWHAIIIHPRLLSHSGRENYVSSSRPRANVRGARNNFGSYPSHFIMCSMWMTPVAPRNLRGRRKSDCHQTIPNQLRLFSDIENNKLHRRKRHE
jgi:hypothetical protein